MRGVLEGCYVRLSGHRSLSEVGAFGLRVVEGSIIGSSWEKAKEVGWAAAVSQDRHFLILSYSI